jgi:hypothetical protein
MKTTSKKAADFTALSADQMNEVKGGYWLRILTSDGKSTIIWVP